MFTFASAARCHSRKWFRRATRHQSPVIAREALERRLVLAASPVLTFGVEDITGNSFGSDQTAYAVVGDDVLVVGDQNTRSDPSDSESNLGTAKLYDLNTGDLIHQLDDPTPGRFSSFGASVVGLSGGRVLVTDTGSNGPFDPADPPESYVFDVATGERLLTIPDPAGTVSFTRFGTDVTAVGTDRVVISSTGLGVAYLFDVNSGSQLQTFSSLTSGFGFDIAAYAGGTRFASGGNVLTIFDVTTGALINTFGGDGGGDFYARKLVALGDDRLLVSSDDGKVHLLDASGTLVRTFTNPEGGNTSFGSSIGALDSGKVLVSAPSRSNSGVSDDTRDGAVYVFDVVTGRVLDLLLNPSGQFQFPDAFVTAPGEKVVTFIHGFGPPILVNVFDASQLFLRAAVDATPLLEGGTLDFGDVLQNGAGPVRSVTLENPGPTPVAATLSLPVGFTREGGEGSAVNVPAGGSVTIDLRLSDTSQRRRAGGIARITAGNNSFAFSVVGNVAEAFLPDGGTPLVSTRTVTGATGKVSDVNVLLNITHPEIEDLTLTLVSPSGKRLELFSKIGNSIDTRGTDDPTDDVLVLGANLVNTRLDDDARRQGNGPFTEDVPRIGTVNGGDDTPPFTGSYRTENSFVINPGTNPFDPSDDSEDSIDLLATFDGEVADGTWSLEIVDDEANGRTGTLDDWTLELRDRGLSFLNENGELLDDFTSVIFSTQGNSGEDGPPPFELSGEPGPSKQLFIRNDGDVPLPVGAFRPPVDTDGLAGFIVVDAPAPGTILQPGQQVPFVIQQLFLTDREYGDDLTMDGNDERFVVTGAYARPEGRPEIGLYRNPSGVPVTNGQPAAVDFGSTPQGGAGASVSLSVRNLGAGADLTLSSLQLPTGFTVQTADDRPFDRSLAGDETGVLSFRVTMAANVAPGEYAGQVSFTTNDSDESTFTFTVRGTVAAADAPNVEPPPPTPVVPPPTPDNTGPVDPTPSPSSPLPTASADGLMLTALNPVKLLGSFVAGDKKAKGTVSVTFALQGSMPSGALGSVEVFLSADSTFSSADQKVSLPAKSVVVKAPKPAKAGKTPKPPKVPKALKVKLVFPAGIVPGTYRLVARLTGSGISGNESFAVSGNTISIT